MIRALFAAATLVAIAAPALPSQALAADRSSLACLNRAEQKAAISNGQAVTLAAAIGSVRGSVRGRGSREVVRARLCREASGLVYVLTVLARDGKVTHATVDASSGRVVEAR